jgi:creatinine amidohydrolase
VALSRHPEDVRRSEIPGSSARPDWDEPQLDFTKYSTSGVIGDPSYASAELGSALWDVSVNELAEMLHQFAEQSTPPVG